MTFSSNFLHAVTFLHVLHLDVLKRQIEIETESKNSNILMYGYNAGQPMAIPIYTVLPYCVIYTVLPYCVIIMQVIATKSIHLIIQELMNLLHGNKFSSWEDFFVNPFSSDVISPNNYVSVHVSVQVLVETHAVEQ